MIRESAIHAILMFCAKSVGGVYGVGVRGHSLGVGIVYSVGVRGHGSPYSTVYLRALKPRPLTILQNIHCTLEVGVCVVLMLGAPAKAAYPRDFTKYTLHT